MDQTKAHGGYIAAKWVNTASTRGGSIRPGQPSTLHRRCARQLRATARVVIVVQIVDDPSSLPTRFSSEGAPEKERDTFLEIIEELVKWENTTDEVVLQKERDEIWLSIRKSPLSDEFLPTPRRPRQERRRRPHDCAKCAYHRTLLGSMVSWYIGILSGCSG